MVKGSHHTEESKAKIGKNPKCGFQKGNKPTHMFKGMEPQYSKYTFKKNELMELYVEKELTQNDISKIKGCDPALVSHHMKKFGIKARKPKDIKGNEFGKLTARYYVGKNKHNKSLYFCECECGGTKIVTRNALVTGATNSCGCSMKGENNHNWIGGKKTFTCKECDEGFERYECDCNDGTHTNEFCSTKCSAIWRGQRTRGKDNPKYKRVIRECGFCGKELEVHPSRAKNYENNFCPREEGEGLSKCHIAWMSENYAGKGNPRFNGWSSVRPYAPIFGDQKYRDILWARHGDLCMNPNCLGEHLDKPKFLHHIDHEKENTLPENQIGLCGSCNGIAENKETWDYYIKLYQGITAELNNQEAMEYFNNYYTAFMDFVFSNPEQQLSLLEAVNQ